jgi:hypothetical protein
MRNVLISATTGFLALTVGSTAAFAASAPFCDKYAFKAVNAEERNLDDDCGYTGARWSFDMRRDS